MKHFVYRLTALKPKDNRKYYCGKHSGKLNDLETGKYKTSSKIISSLFNKNNFSIKIIKVFNTSIDALKFEGFYHHKLNVQDHPLFFNQQNQTISPGFDRTGRVSVINTKSGERLSISTDEYYKNDHFESITKNNVLCKDKHGNISINSKKEYDNRDDLVGINKGFIFCRTKENGEKVKITKDEYYKNKHLYEYHLKKISAYDLITKKKIQINHEEFHKNERYVGIRSFVKERKEKCSICERNIGASNLNRHEKSHYSKILWITDFNNKNTYKTLSIDFFQKYQNDYYIIEKNKDKTFGFIDGIQYNIRYIGKVKKHLI